MSVSYETSSKIHASSLQNEGFVRDFLQKSHVKVSKTRISYETSSRSFIRAHTSSSPAKQFRDFSPSKQHPLTRQSQCHSNIHLHHNSQSHDSLHLPRIFPRPHLQHTQSTAPAMKCDLRHASQPHGSLRLPRKLHFHASKPTQSTAHATKSVNIISRELEQNLHRTRRLEFPHVLSTLPSTKIAISAETGHEHTASMQHLETQIPMSQPHPTPQKHHSPNANPNVIAQKTHHLTKRCACAVISSSILHPLTFPRVSSPELN